MSTFLSSVCHAYSYINESADILYDKLQEYLPENIHNNLFTNEQVTPSEEVNQCKDLMYDTVTVINELKKNHYDINRLSEDTKSKLNQITTWESGDNYFYYFGALGEELYTILKDVNEGKVSGTDYASYFENISTAYTKLYNKFIEVYYNNTNEETGDNGLVEVNPDDVKPDEEINNINEGIVNEDGGFEGNTDTGNGSGILEFLDFAFGVLLYPIKLLLLVPGLVGQGILSAIVSGGEGSIVFGVSVDQILFNQLAITDINIFSNVTAAGKDLIGSTMIMEIRSLIANWYYAFRNFVIVTYLCILIYIGIRMAISSIADDKAKYKNMLKNWFVGLALVIVLHFMIILIIQINNQLLMAIQPTSAETGEYTNLMSELFKQAFWVDFTTSFGSVILYSILTVLTFIFLIVYVRRMITISFLICVAPLITLTYPIDKATDNKSQILNSWLKEFISDVLIQFFHCIIYVVLVQSSFDNMLKAGSLDFGAMFVSIVMTCCIFYVEGIVKKLFGLDQGGSTFLKTLVMGKVLGDIGNNLKVIRGSKNDNQQHTQEVPNYMPSGETISDAAREAGLPNHVVRNLEHQENGQETPHQKKNVARRAGKTYLGALDTVAGMTVPGYNRMKNKRKMKYHMSLKETQKLFNIVCEDYIQSKNPHITKEEFKHQMEALNETKIGDLKDGKDVAMKEMMMSLQRAYEDKPTSIRQVKEKLIDEKMYSSEERLKRSIDSFARQYQFKEKNKTNL